MMWLPQSRSREGGGGGEGVGVGRWVGRGWHCKSNMIVLAAQRASLRIVSLHKALKTKA